MYIGKPSVSDLFMFLAGYKTARRELGIEPSEQENEFYGEFQPWLQKRFKVQSVNSWAKIIMLYSVDEKEGFASELGRRLREMAEAGETLEKMKRKYEKFTLNLADAPKLLADLVLSQKS